MTGVRTHLASIKENVVELFQTLKVNHLIVYKICSEFIWLNPKFCAMHTFAIEKKNKKKRTFKDDIVVRGR